MGNVSKLFSVVCSPAGSLVLVVELERCSCLSEPLSRLRLLSSVADRRGGRSLREDYGGERLVFVASAFSHIRAPFGRAAAPAAYAPCLFFVTYSQHRPKELHPSF